MKDLRITGAAKTYGRHGPRVLAGVDLQVPSGHFTAILGASGSGKTTLLRLIAGFERLDEGEIALGDDVVDDAGLRFTPSERRRIGYVPQEGALFPHLSVGRNVGFGLRRSPRRAERVAELLEMVGLEGLHRRYPHQLSGGQQQRVALARALATDPEIVLLDEPFSSLDATMRSSVRAEVRAVLRQAGTTSVLVTHDQDEALSMADEVAVLRGGVIAQRDTPAGLYGLPQDPGLARFLGESNLFEAMVTPASTKPQTALTPLGRLNITGWPGPPEGGPAQVLVRPEQVRLEVPAGDSLAGTVSSYEYFGHDAVIRVKTDAPGLEELVVRITGGSPLTVGSQVGLAVEGSVVAWPRPGGGAHATKA